MFMFALTAALSPLLWVRILLRELSMLLVSPLALLLPLIALSHVAISSFPSINYFRRPAGERKLTTAPRRLLVYFSLPKPLSVDPPHLDDPVSATNAFFRLRWKQCRLNRLHLSQQPQRSRGLINQCARPAP
jgi:hypothetical protein